MNKADVTKVLVTGGSGYVASWIVRKLLDRGYHVTASVRSLANQNKVKHLVKMQEEFPTTLDLVEADLLQLGSFDPHAQGCRFVFHTASPFQVESIKSAQKELVDPSLEGTRNVLSAVSKSQSVEKVILTSSVAAVAGDNADVQSLGRPANEADWNTTSTLHHQPYAFSKTIAEREAWQVFRSQEQWQLITMNPGLILGPALSHRMDGTSTKIIKSYFDGRFKAGVPRLNFGVVDVREVADAHIAAVERDHVDGRYILVSETSSMLRMAKIISQKFKHPNLPKKPLPNLLLYLFGPFIGMPWRYLKRNLAYPVAYSSEKSINGLGVQYRSLESTLWDHTQQLMRDHVIPDGAALGPSSIQRGLA
ncbi:NAD-dependent epimerase/dehydratase family protein [Pseudobacteriovorax antillogorgiicola]|uniref:Nucleoside-diphosphate-sugar epimerase n=1 Tax=Pseudobacteriovorax antillogorgiicola TaxID=1513793 RepID=A0A1Y6BRS3_9BACT|nr:NAD-dependent epimerase/dehydratase family protein [Pseudobacteriovorax antillogorgiicola]TCS54610.1 nucleoside-diphosphate-sugar epimerase [Pseudobacteriovorax antillogorgiicola]SMF17544.1 Nucleoside-diphosphate-sugar epimerase [Pseudobacteriovorax antillogorgiicola]